MNRITQIATVLVIVGLIIWLALPIYGDYTPRVSVSAAIVYTVDIKSALDAACSEGTFESKQRLTDLGKPNSDPKAYTYRAELSHLAQNSARLKAYLSDIYAHPFFGLIPWKVVSQGRFLEFEFTCTADRKFSSRFIGSDLEPKYLPASLRGS